MGQQLNFLKDCTVDSGPELLIIDIIVLQIRWSVGSKAYQQVGCLIIIRYLIYWKSSQPLLQSSSKGNPHLAAG